MGITEQTFYRWKSKYGGMEVSEAKRLKQLEEENRRLKGLVADLTLNNHILKEVLGKTSEACREAKESARNRAGVQDQRAKGLSAHGLEPEQQAVSAH